MNWNGEATENWVGTNLGRRIGLSYPMADQIDIEDIATGLGNQCRFTGQLREFYSVAEHCIHVAELVPPRDKLAALLHDAQEAFIGDLSTPMKNEVGNKYREVEDRIVRALDEKFCMGGTLIALPNSVKLADRIMLLTERDALQQVHIWWGDEFESTPRHPSFVHLYKTPAEARAAYLAYFNELVAMRKHAQQEPAAEVL